MLNESQNSDKSCMWLHTFLVDLAIKIGMYVGWIALIAWGIVLMNFYSEVSDDKSFENILGAIFAMIFNIIMIIGIPVISAMVIHKYILTDDHEFTWPIVISDVLYFPIVGASLACTLRFPIYYTGVDIYRTEIRDIDRPPRDDVSRSAEYMFCQIGMIIVWLIYWWRSLWRKANKHHISDQWGWVMFVVFCLVDIVSLATFIYLSIQVQDSNYDDGAKLLFPCVFTALFTAQSWLLILHPGASEWQKKCGCYGWK